MADGNLPHTFAPSLGTITRAIGRPPKALYDCGKHGQLSAAQIARVAGIDREAVVRRIASGVTGVALCAPRKQYPRRPCRHKVAALRIAFASQDRTPTLDEIKALSGYSEREAGMWLRAIEAVKRGGEE